MLTDEMAPRYRPWNRTLWNTTPRHVRVKGQGLGLVVQSPHKEVSQPTRVKDMDLGIVEVSVVIGALGVGQNTGQSSVVRGRLPRAECHGPTDGWKKIEKWLRRKS